MVEACQLRQQPRRIFGVHCHLRVHTVRPQSLSLGGIGEAQRLFRRKKIRFPNTNMVWMPLKTGKRILADFGTIAVSW